MTDLVSALRELVDGYPVLTGEQALAAGAGPAVVVLIDWTLQLAQALARHAHNSDAVQLPVRVDGPLAVVGPVQRRGLPGCLSCAERQRLAATTGRVPRREPRLRLGGTLSPALLDGVAALAADVLATDARAADMRAADMLDGAERDHAQAGGLVWVLHDGRGTWSTHRIRPVGGCDVCQPLPPDAAPEPGQLRIPRPLPDPAVLRQPNPRTTLAALRAALSDDRFGPVHHVYRTEDSAFCLTGALLATGRETPEGGYGRSGDYASSERVALFEALERFAGQRPTGSRAVLRAPFEQLDAARAVDPQRLGLPDPAFDGHPASATTAYTPQLDLDWVHGLSLTRDRPIAVPEHVAYYDSPCQPRVVYECSNGCGLGNSIAEATLYGLFELAERDAFLMAWYARTPLRAVVPPPDPTVAQLVDRAAMVDYRVWVLDATNDLAVPAVIALAEYRGTARDAPRMFLAAGAHHDPVAAIRGAVVEVVTNVFHFARRAATEPGWYDRQRLLRLWHEPHLVRTLDDHVGVNTLPQAVPRWDFLVAQGDEPLPWREVWPGAPAPVPDLTQLLAATVRRLAGLGLEVVVVDISEPGARAQLGLHAVKVVVPGTLPMTFGHVNHRTRGLPRLLDVPHRLGRATRPLRHTDLTIHPHPFP